MSCVFCDIKDKKIDAQIVYEDEWVIAFNDISKAAPVHILVIPKQHIESVSCIDDTAIVSRIFDAIKKITSSLQINGYRIVNNCGADGGQTVSHVHFHLLAGRQMQWPPG